MIGRIVGHRPLAGNYALIGEYRATARSEASDIIIREDDGKGKKDDKQEGHKHPIQMCE